MDDVVDDVAMQANIRSGVLVLFWGSLPTGFSAKNLARNAVEASWAKKRRGKTNHGDHSRSE